MKIWILLLTFLLAACAQPDETGPVVKGLVESNNAGGSEQYGLPEAAITQIMLAGPLAGKNAEISGLDWYQDQLIMLPQHPDFSEEGSFLYALSRSDIEAYLDGKSNGPLTAAPILFVTPDYEQMIEGFEGFEAIAFDGQDVYLTIEADTKAGMRGYLVRGKISPDLSEVVLETEVPVEIRPQADLKNQTYEALLVAGDLLLTIYEANGALLNENPQVYRFNKELKAEEPLAFPAIEYRITDATALDENGRFWVSNYYSGSDKFDAKNDPIAEAFGTGETHGLYEHGERLLELQLTDSEIILSGAAPIQLELPNEDARKWEGLARLGERGFLIATDKSPQTILAFVESSSP